MIDKTTHYIQQDPEAAEVYKSLEEIGEELPTGSPRFVLLSYPLKSSDGRTQVPYMLLYYLPSACNDQMKMMYAGAKELMRSTSGVGRVIDITSLEDLEELQEEFDNKQ
ncbi:hypothetical protein QQS21_006144 [Conoideocrella luteorostrata]|uniref:ADF-H domain-containing protein n=1 Tax=Conoideocrella luteorostrata TaxID=1105319 RepID=A0AAJ0CQH4_9HYPO|nr:hypothetical protein QQS21_006144 [Conoideocrella luteorostrata]